MLSDTSRRNQTPINMQTVWSTLEKLYKVLHNTLPKPRLVFQISNTGRASAIRGRFTSNSSLEPCGLFPNIKSFSPGKSRVSAGTQKTGACAKKTKRKKKPTNVIRSNPWHSVKASCLWHLYRAFWSNYVLEWTTLATWPWVAQTTWIWRVQLRPSLSKAIMPPTTHFILNNASFIDMDSSTKQSQ